MTFSIEKFKNGGLRFGGARPTLFRVFIPIFQGAETDHDIHEKITFLAKATSIPPSIIDYIDIPYMGRKVRVNGDRTFPDWTVTVMNDEDFEIRRALEDWHQFINSREKNIQHGTGYSLVSRYKEDLEVYQYGKTGDGPGGVPSTIGTTLGGGEDEPTPIATYTFVGAFPTSISPIALDWDSVNQVEQFDVTFAYDYWESLIPTAVEED